MYAQMCTKIVIVRNHSLISFFPSSDEELTDFLDLSISISALRGNLEAIMGYTYSEYYIAILGDHG